MVANLSNIAESFNKCNKAYFEGILPIPQFDLLHSYKTCGYFQYTKGDWGDNSLYDATISITDFYDFTESQFCDIICHEMIHYYLAYTGEDRNCRHGKKFKTMAESLSLNYGLHITPHLDLSQFKKREGASKLSAWFSHQHRKPSERFFEEWNGFIWEYHSFGEYLQALLCRLIGGILGIVILILLLWFIGKYG